MNLVAQCVIAARISTLVAVPAHASVNKTWVASYGTDTGTCALSAPYKTFQYAHDQTSPGGEIDVKDSGGYGHLTITKAISVVADHVLASISVPAGQTGIIINAGSSDNVFLRGFTLDDHGTANERLEMYLAGTLVIENCTISNMSSIGLVFRNQGSVMWK